MAPEQEPGGEDSTRLLSLEAQVVELARVQRVHEERWDTFMHSPVWKRLWFWLLGWPFHEIYDETTHSAFRRWRMRVGL